MTEPKKTLTRFYKDVSLQEEGGGFTVTLDGRVARTPGRHPLAATRRPLADALAEEWHKAPDEIDLADLPLTRLHGFVLDGGEAARSEWAETVLSYAGTDLLCYRAEDAALAGRQAELWQPILDRVGGRLGADFAVTAGIVAVDQPPALRDAITAALAEMDLAVLFAAKMLTEALGSAALSLDIVAGDLSAEDAFNASHLDETHQEERWGTDAEALARRERLSQEIGNVCAYLTLVNDAG